MKKIPYHWSSRDKWLYAISLIPFSILFFGVIYLLAGICIYMSVLWLLIYLVLNIVQGYCCIACPYKGKYCPAIFGVYLGNIISGFLYSEYEFDQKLFKLNARWAEFVLAIFILYPLYWLYTIDWYYVLIYIGLMVLHIVLFIPTQCSKCSFNDLCPGGVCYSKFRRLGQWK